MIYKTNIFYCDNSLLNAPRFSSVWSMEKAVENYFKADVHWQSETPWLVNLLCKFGETLAALIESSQSSGRYGNGSPSKVGLMI